MNKKQYRPRRLAGFWRPEPLAIHPQGNVAFNVAFLGPVFTAPDLAPRGSRRARALRRQRARESSGNEAEPCPLDDRAPRQQVIEFFHGFLHYSGCPFLRILPGAATCAAPCLNYQELAEYCSKPGRFAEAALRCSAQQLEHHRGRQQACYLQIEVYS